MQWIVAGFLLAVGFWLASILLPVTLVFIAEYWKQICIAVAYVLVLSAVVVLCVIFWEQLKGLIGILFLLGLIHTILNGAVQRIKRFFKPPTNSSRKTPIDGNNQLKSSEITSQIRN